MAITFRYVFTAGAVLAGVIAAAPAPAKAADADLALVLTCTAKDALAQGAEAKEVDVSVGVLKGQPLKAVLMLTATKGGMADVVTLDANALYFTYSIKTFTVMGKISRASLQFDYLLTNTATNHGRHFVGHCARLDATSF